MRQKDWLAQVLSEASQRVESWPEWKKSAELADSSSNTETAKASNNGMSDSVQEPEAK